MQTSRHPYRRRVRRTGIHIGTRVGAGLLLALALLAGCGGGDSVRVEAPALPTTPSTPTVGPAGGTVQGPDGARVDFPAGALAADVTVRITKDGTGAPVLPAEVVKAAGAVFSITPHGGDFKLPAAVRIPVTQMPADANEQLLLLTASPGDTQWRVLSGARIEGSALVTTVHHFSHFMPIIMVNRSMPQLVTRVEGRNNQGSGAGYIGPDQELNDFPLGNLDRSTGGYWAEAKMRIQARLSFPAQVNAVRPGVPLPVQCVPLSYAHDAVQWRISSEGQPLELKVDHRRRGFYATAAEEDASLPHYPAYEAEDDFYEWFRTYLGVGTGFGAMHYYGRTTSGAPRGDRAGTQADPYVLPPLNNMLSDDVMTWTGNFAVESKNNGRQRVEAVIATSCGLLLEAPAVSYRVNVAFPSTRPGAYQGLIWLPMLFGNENPQQTVPGGAVTVYYLDEMPRWTQSVAWEHSTDGVAWTRPATLTFTVTTRDDLDNKVYELRFPSVQPAHTGYWRAFACGRDVGANADTRCVTSPPVDLRIVTVPPVFTLQPQSTTAFSGQTASFSVGLYLGVPGGYNHTIARQTTTTWQSRRFINGQFTAWQTIPNAIGNMLTTPALVPADNLTQVRAVSSNAIGSAASDAAWLWVAETPTQPVITSEPGDMSMLPGSTAAFTAAASGGGLSYQWRFNGEPITGANAPTLTLANITLQQSGHYDLVVSNSAGSATTRRALLDVRSLPIALPPVITGQPASVAVAEGGSASFAVGVSGSGPFTYAWFKDGGGTPVATTALLQFASVRAGDAGSYTVRITNVMGSVTSNAAMLTVGTGGGTATPPVIVTPPTAVAAFPGSSVTLAVAATGSGPLLYRWLRDGVEVPGATGAVLTLSGVNSLQAGQYTVEVSNGAGVAASTPVALVVIGAPSITQQPVAVRATENANATFSVGASGDQLRYQWTRNHVAIIGATSASYTTPALALADSGASYGVVVYSGAGVVLSQQALLTVTPQTDWTDAQQVSTHIGYGSVSDSALAFGGQEAWALWIQPGETGGVLRASHDQGNGNWTAPVEVQGTIDNAFYPRIAASANRTVVTFGTQTPDGRYHLMATARSGTAWSAPVRLDSSHEGNMVESQLVMTADDNALAVWAQYDGNRYAVFASRWNGGSWTAPIAVDSGSGDSNTLFVATNSRGDAVISWRQAARAMSATVTMGSGAFAIGTPQLASSATTVWANRAVIDRNGNETMVWRQNSSNGSFMRELWAARRTPGGSWGAPVRVVAQVMDTLDNIELVADDSGAVVLAYVTNNTQSAFPLAWSVRFDPAAQAWGAPVQHSIGGLHALEARLAADARGRHVLTWFERSADGTSDRPVATAWNPATASWGPRAFVDYTPQQGTLGRLAVAPGGRAAMVWSKLQPGQNDYLLSSSFLPFGDGGP